MPRTPPGPIAALAVLALLALPQVAGAYERLPRPLAGLSPAHFAERVRIADDPLEAAVVLSTRDGYTRSRSIEGARADDVHLRAVIDRATGRVSWQVWHDLAYVGGSRDLAAVHYLAGGSLRQSEPLLVEHWEDLCPATDGIGSCSQFTRIAFELPEDAVREIAAAWRAGAREPWRLRFKDRRGRDVTGGLAPAEVAGLVGAVDAWRSGAG
jgi:hypothetical protein